jgi:hypothetical protein
MSIRIGIPYRHTRTVVKSTRKRASRVTRGTKPAVAVSNRSAEVNLSAAAAPGYLQRRTRSAGGGLVGSERRARALCDFLKLIRCAYAADLLADADLLPASSADNRR